MAAKNIVEFEKMMESYAGLEGIGEFEKMMNSFVTEPVEKPLPELISEIKNSSTGDDGFVTLTTENPLRKPTNANSFPMLSTQPQISFP